MANMKSDDEKHAGKKNVTVWLSPEIVNAVDLIAEREDRTRAAIIKRSLAFYARARHHPYPESETRWIDLD